MQKRDGGISQFAMVERRRGKAQWKVLQIAEHSLSLESYKYYFRQPRINHFNIDTLVGNAREE